jgi:hypothetical protein
MDSAPAPSSNLPKVLIVPQPVANRAVAASAAIMEKRFNKFKVASYLV